LNLPGGPVEKLQAEFALELANREADGALRKPDLLRCPTEASVPGDRKKRPELTQGHIHLKNS
jgi:hypothetical protein